MHLSIAIYKITLPKHNEKHFALNSNCLESNLRLLINNSAKSLIAIQLTFSKKLRLILTRHTILIF